MHGVAELQKIAAARLEDARALHRAGRFDGATYLAGYAVELALKARICVTLGWAGFPETRSEFEGYQCLRTHYLAILLRFSGVERAIRTSNIAEWSIVLSWDTARRYSAATSTEHAAGDMLTATVTLVGVL